MGDDACHPDESAEPPDNAESTRERGGVQRVEMTMSRAIKEGPGEDDEEEHRPERPDEPSNKLQVKSGGPTDVQVEPGGETKAEQIKRAAHKDVGAEVDRKVAETC